MMNIIANAILSLIFCSMLYFCNTGVQHAAENITSINTATSDNYKIKKIIIKDSIYVLYAVRNDSIFKIISRRKAQQNCVEHIRVGGRYPLDLKPNYIRNTNLLVTYLEYYGTLVSRERSSRYEVYTANNLDGLCIKQ